MMFKSDDVQHPAETRRRERRAVTVTPLDLRQYCFGAAFRGYDRDEVASFLSEAAADYEHAVRENERLREDMARLESSIAQFRNLEASLKTALVSAQKVSDDMRATAEHEAARIVREAEARAKLIRERAQSRLEDVQREIEGVMLKRRHAVTGIESTISALHNTLDFIREQESRERGETPARPAAPTAQVSPVPEGSAPAVAARGDMGAKTEADEAPEPARPDCVLPYQPRSEAASRFA
jgi:cell division initiation protein